MGFRLRESDILSRELVSPTCFSLHVAENPVAPAAGCHRRRNGTTSQPVLVVGLKDGSALCNVYFPNFGIPFGWRCNQTCTRCTEVPSLYTYVLCTLYTYAYNGNRKTLINMDFKVGKIQIVKCTFLHHHVRKTLHP